MARERVNLAFGNGHGDLKPYLLAIGDLNHRYVIGNGDLNHRYVNARLPEGKTYN